MLVIYILITWINCMASTVSSSVEHRIPVCDLQQHVTMNEDEVVRDNLTGNPSISKIDLLRRLLFYNIPPIDSQNVIDKVNALLSLSSISLEDPRGGNAENFDFLQLWESRKQRLLSTKDKVLIQLTERDVAKKHSLIQNEGNSPNATFRDVNTQQEIDRIAHESDPIIEKIRRTRKLSSDDRKTNTFPVEAREWLYYYCFNNSEQETGRKITWMKFARYQLCSLRMDQLSCYVQ